MSLETWQHRRVRVACVCVLLAFVGLIVRLAWVQIRDHDFYQKLADRGQTTRIPLYAHRGLILDREGRALAISTEADSVVADPARISEKSDVPKILSQVLQLDYVDVLNKIENKKQRFAWIKRKVSKEEAEQVKRLNLQGIGLQSEEKRTYPLNWLASHVIGFVDMDNKGAAGIEMLFDKCLAGGPGYQCLRRDRDSRSISSGSLDYKPPRHGYTVVLTLDTVIQQFLEEELDYSVAQFNPVAAMAIAISPQTGEILALANRPSFNPNEYSKYEAATQRNRAITDYFEPGSTFKTFVVMAALEQRVVDVDTVFDCHRGVFRVGRRTLHDVHPYGRLTVSEILIHSSNIGMGQIGMAMGKRGLMSCVEAFSFGQLTGVELPAEDPGKVQKKWTEYSITSVPMGQEIGLTPLQLAAAYVAIANGGNLYKPRIVRGVADSTGAKMLKLFPTPCRARRVASAEVIKKKLTPMLCDVVNVGTAAKAKLPGYTIAGKTGTSQKMGPGGPSGKYVGSFVGFAPASDPKVVVLMMLDEPKNGEPYGGRVAAPGAAKIIYRTLKYWHVPNDIPEERAASGTAQETG
jgi:cell division protein FtsI (penicillin-binding protein 3)